MKQIFELTEDDIKTAIRTHVAQAQGVTVEDVYLTMHVSRNEGKEITLVALTASVECEDHKKPKFEGSVPRD